MQPLEEIVCNAARFAMQKAGISWQYIAQDMAHKRFNRVPDTLSIQLLPNGLYTAAFAFIALKAQRVWNLHLLFRT